MMSIDEILKLFVPVAVVLGFVFRLTIKVSVLQERQKNDKENLRAEFKQAVETLEIKYKSETSIIRENVKSVEKQDDIIMAELRSISQALQKIILIDSDAQRSKERISDLTNKVDLMIGKVDKLAGEVSGMRTELNFKADK